MQARALIVDEVDSRMIVTMKVGGQMFGVNVKHVCDVLRRQKITPVPLAPPEVTGSLNLRGRIVTVIDLRRRLQLPENPAPSECAFVVVEYKNELYSLMVDSVGEVLTIADAQVEHPPANMGGVWKDIATGIHKLPDELIVLADVQALLRL